jgi:hypothetical protein
MTERPDTRWRSVPGNDVPFAPVVRQRPATVEQLPLGTRVRLVSGYEGVLIRCGFTWANIRSDGGIVRSIAPAAEVEVVAARSIRSRSAGHATTSDGVGNSPEIGYGEPVGGFVTRHSDSAIVRPIPGSCDAFNAARCEECGGSFPRGRPHARYCSPRCRTRAYRRRLQQQTSATSDERGWSGP